MLVNAIEGVVENGKIRLREDVPLPENAKVYVIFAEAGEERSARIRTPHLADPRQLGDFKKQIVELAGDAKV
jgi:hypothetical protein